MSADRPGGLYPHGHFSAGRWAGDILFLSGIVPVMRPSGHVILGYTDLAPDVAAQLASGHPSVDVREGPIVAQAWYIFESLRRTVEQQGLSLQHVVRLTPYFTDLRDFPGYNRVRVMVWPESPPASTVVEVKELLPTPDVRLEIEAVVSRELPVEVAW